jgi:hypothetical protein
MPVEYKPFKVTALPATLEANAIYYSQGPQAGELRVTVTSDDGSVSRSVITYDEVDARIAAAVADGSTIKPTADIASRDLLELNDNGLILVLDATDDTSVTEGSALYFYTKSTDSYDKISEFESLELDWAHLKDKPVELVGDIDKVVGDLKGNSDVLKDATKDATTGNFVYNSYELGKQYFAATPEW